jgi:hypothetical protein
VIRWRPTAVEERWIEVGARLGAALPRDALGQRTGGWRGTGPLARMALFALGFVAALLVFGVLGFSDRDALLAAGLIAALGAEWLTVRKRLHASGIEEGLGVAGFLLIGAWFATLGDAGSGLYGGSARTLVLVLAVGAAGWRRLNPFVTTVAVLAFVDWLGSTAVAHSLDSAIGRGMTAFIAGLGIAALALVAGAHEFRRPSYDRMLDWLVATLPLAAYAQHAASGFDPFASVPVVTGTGRLATVALLLALGAALLATGIRRRRHAPFLGFMGCVACLAVELWTAGSLATETWLILCGLAALGAGALLDRLLRQPRHGLISAALAGREGPLDLLQTAGAALVAQRAGAESGTVEPVTDGGGGRFGGGGASGRY